MSNSKSMHWLRRARRTRGECAVCGLPGTDSYRCEKCRMEHRRRMNAVPEQVTAKSGLSWEEVAMIYQHKHGERMTAASAARIACEAMAKLRLECGDVLLEVA